MIMPDVENNMFELIFTTVMTVGFESIENMEYMNRTCSDIN